MNIGELWKNLIKGMRKGAPELMIGIGTGSLLGTTVAAVMETPEALERLKEAEEEKNRKLTTLEKIKVAGPCYIPAAATATFGTGCVIAGCMMQGRKIAALSTACSIAQTGLQEYQSKVLETIGEKKEGEIRDAVVRDKMDRNPPPKEMDNRGEPDGVWGQTLFFDAASGRYFYSDIETLKRAANKLNWQMNNRTEPYISLNEWYMEINMDTVSIGDEIGWNSSMGLIEIRTVPKRRGNGTIVTGLEFETNPQYGFDTF